MSAWAGLLSGLHAMVAMRRGEPHWLLSDNDAKVYGAALGNAVRHLPIGASQKALDFSALIIAAMNFETPRVYQSMHNARARRAQRGSEAPGAGATVFQFRPAPQAGSPTAAAAAAPSSAQAPAAANGGGLSGDGFQADGIDGPIGGH